MIRMSRPPSRRLGDMRADSYARAPALCSSRAPTRRVATLGEALVARLDQAPWASIERWLTEHHPLAGVLERIDRMRRADHEQRADRVRQVIPRRNYDAMGITGAPQTTRASSSTSRRPGALRT